MITDILNWMITFNGYAIMTAIAYTIIVLETLANMVWYNKFSKTDKENLRRVMVVGVAMAWLWPVFILVEIGYLFFLVLVAGGKWMSRLLGRRL
jgi:hypothetical protein